MIDLSQVTDIMLGNETVTQIQDSLGNVLWSATPTPTIADNEIKYTSTNNQKINDFNTTGLTILSHTFENGVGSILLDPTTLSLPEYFIDNVSNIDTIELGGDIVLDNERILASNDVTSVLSSITLPANLTYLGARLFRNRRGVTTLDIPAGVTSIGAFIGWSTSDSLQSIICRPTTPPTIDRKSFVIKEPSNLISNNFVPIVYVPAASVTAYQTASVWSDYVAAGMQILSL